MNRGFTLIELLIVVAIIAILAAIAVPNFLEAQTRAKVSRVKADMRTLSTGLNLYFVDNGAFPKGNNFTLPGRRSFDPPEGIVLERLSTPISYLTTGLLPDPFEAKFRTGGIEPDNGDYDPVSYIGDSNDFLYRFIKYAAPTPFGLADVDNDSEVAQWYFVLISAGPDTIYPNVSGLLRSESTEQAILRHTYDPTNGTVSEGHIWRVGGQTTGNGNYGGPFYRVINSVQK